ncbi:hypothetical protein BV22DRAFT_901283 [Leucogyrophana mollusca]|uniref:Uncharacterized protein n=1 Tax=Leucogyrophana mollusca TaxID=85980 RepID=A0ACB8AZG0_9AGAM|nr:hypothetical protein BV22DRAFT_901283 [Leucogyrophana mollusca]
MNTWAENIALQRSRRSIITKLFSSSLSKETRDFLEATRLLYKQAKKTSDSVAAIKKSAISRTMKTLESSSSSEYVDVPVESLSATDQIGGVSVSLPEGLNEDSRSTIRDVANLVTDAEDNTDTYSNGSDLTITPHRYRQRAKSVSTIPTWQASLRPNSFRSPSQPPSPTRSTSGSFRSQERCNVNITGPFLGNLYVCSQACTNSPMPTYNAGGLFNSGATTNSYFVPSTSGSCPTGSSADGPCPAYT